MPPSPSPPNCYRTPCRLPVIRTVVGDLQTQNNHGEVRKMLKEKKTYFPIHFAKTVYVLVALLCKIMMFSSLLKALTSNGPVGEDPTKHLGAPFLLSAEKGKRSNFASRIFEISNKHITAKKGIFCLFIKKASLD